MAKRPCWAGVMMLAGQNSRIVAQRVEQRLGELQDKLPPGVATRPVHNRSHRVDRALRTAQTNLLEGAIVVVAVLLALLGNCRAGLFVALAIPLSFLFALTGVASTGLSASLAMEHQTEGRLLERAPEVMSVFSRIGTSEVATDPCHPARTVCTSPTNLGLSGAAKMPGPSARSAWSKSPASKSSGICPAFHVCPAHRDAL